LDDEDFEEYLSHLKHYVQRYSKAGVHHQDNIIWELWNEPNHPAFWGAPVEEYFYYARKTVRAIHEADPDACIVGPASAGMAWDYNRSLFAMGYCSLVDGITIHPYRPTMVPETLGEDYAALRFMMCEASGEELPLLCGEIGWGKEDAETQGDYLKRTMRENAQQDIRGTIWYEWRSADGNALVNDQFVKQPAFYAFQELIPPPWGLRQFAAKGEKP